VKRGLFTALLFAALWTGDAQACRLPIYADGSFYGMIISPPPDCKDCGRRFVVMEPETNKPIRVIQLSPIALNCYSPYGAVGEIGTLNVKGAPTDKELMQHSFLVGQKPSVSEQWYPKRKP
jgi:hypothetical protein